MDKTMFVIRIRGWILVSKSIFWIQETSSKRTGVFRCFQIALQQIPIISSWFLQYPSSRYLNKWWSVPLQRPHSTNSLAVLNSECSHFTWTLKISRWKAKSFAEISQSKRVQKSWSHKPCHSPRECSQSTVVYVFSGRRDRKTQGEICLLSIPSASCPVRGTGSSVKVLQDALSLPWREQGELTWKHDKRRWWSCDVYPVTDPLEHSVECGDVRSW